MISFRRIRFQNFLSYGNVMTEIPLDLKSTTVLIGGSGSGKSSVTDAITFALFGKPFRPINKPQLVNSINNSDCLAEIEFDIGDKKYLVRRGIKPNILEIYCNDVLINQDSHTKDYQEYLEKNILNMNFKTFTQIVVLGTSNFTPFMQMKSSDRRALVEDLLDIHIFSTMSVLLKERITGLKNSISYNTTEIQHHKEKIDLYNRYLEDLKRDKQKHIDGNNTKIVDSEKEVQEYNHIISGYDDDIKTLNVLIEDESDIIDKLTTYNEYKRDIESNLKKIKKELDFYEKNKSCPTCSRDFDESYKEQVIQARNNKKEQYEEGISKIKEISEKFENRYEEIGKTKEKIDLLKKQIIKLEIKISSTLQYLDKLRKENDELVERQKGAYTETRELEELNVKLKVLEDERDSFVNDKTIHDIASGLLKDGGIKTRIIRQYLPVMNKLVNRFLESMNFHVSFNIDENFNETIRSRGRDDFTYSCFSEGEKQRLDIAILLTWRTIASMKNSMCTNLLFIDELLDSSLDHIATENIIELINNEPILKNSNIFVISHKTDMTDKFSDHIKFEKYKNFSRIVK